MQKVFEESVSSFKEGTPQNQGDQVLLTFSRGQTEEEEEW